MKLRQSERLILKPQLFGNVYYYDCAKNRSEGSRMEDRTAIMNEWMTLLRISDRRNIWSNASFKAYRNDKNSTSVWDGVVDVVATEPKKAGKLYEHEGCIERLKGVPPVEMSRLLYGEVEGLRGMAVLSYC